jgi:predicted DNA-binding WGR domain protein
MQHWYLELSQDTQHKFYEVWLEDCVLNIRYGRIGEAGQSSTKTFESPEKALAEAEKKLKEKRKSGYADAVLGQRRGKSTYKRLSNAAVEVAFEPWREKYGLPTWFPIVEDRDGNLTDSKFSGLPAFLPDEAAPTCPHCQKRLQLLLQLNTLHFPKEIGDEYGVGLIQVFLCTQQLCRGSASGEAICRLIANDTPEHQTLPTFEEAFPAKKIIGWQLEQSYPDDDELEQYGVVLDSLDNEDDDILIRVTCDEFNVRYVSDDDESIWSITPHGGGARLSGYPSWYYNSLSKCCPICLKPMRMVFEFDSDDHIPFWFGRYQRGHLMQCKTHKTELSLIW